MNFKTILTVIVVIVALYLLYYFLLASKTSSLISQMPAMSETKLKIVKAKDLEQQWGTDFAFSIWYAVDNWNTNTTVKKNIFSNQTIIKIAILFGSIEEKHTEIVIKI